MASRAAIAREILARRKYLKQAIDPDDILKDAFSHQRRFIEDPSKLKAVFCTRRAAKSYSVGLHLVTTALKNPGSNCLFIGLTRQSAKNIIWKDILKILNQKYKLGASFNQTELTMTLPNGSVIRVTGVDTDEDEMNKLLGMKYRLVCIDEASMYTIDLRNLVYGVLKPAMTDPNATGERGTICLTGTSSNFTRGLFYDITTGAEPGWSLHSWSAHDNPYVARQWQEELDDIKTNRPLYTETPQFKQWYLNLWVVDEEKLVYKFSPERNLAKEMPFYQDISGWVFVLGVDLGWEDDTGIVLTGYHINDPNMYVIRSFKKPKMTFDQVIDKVNEFRMAAQHVPVKFIVDGANKQGVESMMARSKIPFEYADKIGKVDFIELFNSDLVQGKIKYLSDAADVWKEQMALVWKTDGDKIRLPKTEHPSLPNHLCDALLYAWRMGYHYNSTPGEKKVVKYSKEWYAQQAEQIWEREREHIERQANQSEWAEAGDWQ